MATPWDKLSQESELEFRALQPPKCVQGRVYLGELLAQATACAFTSVDADFDLNSFHSYFVKKLDLRVPIRYVVEKTRSGRSFAFRSVQLRQRNHIYGNDETFYHFEFTFKRRSRQPTLKFTQAQFPAVPQPERLRSNETLLTHLPRFGWALDDAKLPHFHGPLQDVLEFVPCAGIEFVLGPQRPTHKQCVWIKSRLAPEDRNHVFDQTLCTFVADIGLNFTDQAGRRSAFRVLTSTDHSGWVHDIEFTTNDYFLLEQECQMWSDGKALIQCRLWTRSQQLIASFTQEAITEKIDILDLKTAPKDALAKI